jgi:CubicO group peptidase (beta-lactamase class C family)
MIVHAQGSLPAPPRSAPATTAHGSESRDSGLTAQRLQRIDQLIARRITAQDISGAVTLVARHGRIVHFQAQGLMDVDAKKAMTKDALFNLASMTKPVTTTAVLMLVEEGRVRLTDPVSQFIPQFKDMRVAAPDQKSEGTPANRQITIRDLLTHTSGIISAARIPPPAKTLANFIPTLGAEPLEFQPGTRWAYSNTVGFDVLARIVEVASGQTFDRFLRDRFFDPIGM